MKVEKRAQKLLAAANRGDATARATLDELQAKYHKSDSDVLPVRRRGRPNKIDSAALDTLVHIGAVASETTRRTKENLMYQAQALLTLLDNRPAPRRASVKRWGWLLRADGGVFHARGTIVSQLGRIGDETARKIFADHLCKLKPRTRDGVKLLRAWENGALRCLSRACER